MDMLGKKVLIKIDNRPSQSKNVMMCAQLRNHGIYLYLGISNTTSEKKETDCGYGHFKMFFVAILWSHVQIACQLERRFFHTLVSQALHIFWIEPRGRNWWIQRCFQSRIHIEELLLLLRFSLGCATYRSMPQWSKGPSGTWSCKPRGMLDNCHDRDTGGKLFCDLLHLHRFDGSV